MQLLNEEHRGKLPFSNYFHLFPSLEWLRVEDSELSAQEDGLHA